MIEDYGYKVSKPGIDITEAKDLDLSFSTKFNHEKIWKSGTVPGTSLILNNDFGYPVRYKGYINISGKYFVHYDKVTVFPGFVSTYGFENSVYGHIKVGSDNIYMTADSANTLVYVLDVDPSVVINPEKNLQRVDYGVKLSKSGIDTIKAGDNRLSMTSEYRSFKVIKEGAVTITADAISSPPETDKTNTFDVSNPLGYAAHVVVFDERGKTDAAYLPFPIGIESDFVSSNTEVYVDKEKIRFRVSRKASYFFEVGASAPAQDFHFYYYLTDYPLPN